MKNSYVIFSVGGRTNKMGQVKYNKEGDFQDLQHLLSEWLTTISEDTGDVYVVDDSGKVLIEGEEDIAALTGVIDFDGEYDSWYATDLYESGVSEKEIEALWKAYLDGENMSEELKEFVCEQKGLKYASDIKLKGYELIVYNSLGERIHDEDLSDYDFSEEDTEAAEKDWKESFCDIEGFDEDSAARIADKIMTLYH